MKNPNALIDRKRFIALLGCGASQALVSRGAFGQGERSSGSPPNFVVIFTDDQGYNDIGCFGSPDIKTPNLDRMAADGMKFTDFYVPAPVCTPSRAALLTGCYPQRVGLPVVLFPNSTIGINSEEITIAELLKPRGYATACIGKWHLGHLPPFLPTRHGFDYYYGLPYSNDMRPTSKRPNYPALPLMRNEEVIEENPDQRQLTERYTAQAIQFIKENKGRPFFLYLPHTFPHVPLYVSERFKGTSARGLYGDVIECIDWSTGRILDTLKELGLDDNTLVIFTSDNGPWLVMKENGGSAAPLRAGKNTTYEGGMRVPCIMRWPGKIPAGSVCSEIATTMDLLPTFAALAGGTPPTDRTIDGKDIRPLLAGTPDVKSPHEAFFYYGGGGYNLEAVRSGRWKLVFERTLKKEFPYRRIAGGGETVPEALYDLEKDIGEQNNLIADHPDVADRLRALAETMRADLGDSLHDRRGANRRPPGRVSS